MKSLLYPLVVTLFLSSGVAVANHHDNDNYEMHEKAADKGRDAKRAVKKGYNRTKEAVCMDSDAECAAKKAGHRIEETKDKAVDKTKELKNKVD